MNISYNYYRNFCTFLLMFFVCLTHYLPNIFTFELTGLAFVLFDDKLLLIPGHMIKIYIKEKPIFNIYLRQINELPYNKEVIDKFKEKILFKIINKQKDLDIIKKLIIKNEKLIIKFCSILYIMSNNDYYFIDLINHLFDKIYKNEDAYDIDQKWDQYQGERFHFNNSFDYTSIKKYLCDIDCNKTKDKYGLVVNRQIKRADKYTLHIVHGLICNESKVQNKYLKYKNKYFSLKNKINNKFNFFYNKQYKKLY